MLSKIDETVAILETLPEAQLEMVYRYAWNVKEKLSFDRTQKTSLILERLTGIIPDDNKTLEDYRQERLAERYGHIN